MGFKRPQVRLLSLGPSKGNEKDIAQETPDFIGGFAVSTVEIFTSDFVDVKKVFFPFCSEPNSRTTEYKPPSAWIRTNPCAFLFPQKGGKPMGKQTDLDEVKRTAITLTYYGKARIRNYGICSG